MADEPEDRAATRKERARQARHDAYQRAKEWKANDPRQIAMKEALKQRRREANAAAKEKRKAAKRAEKRGDES